MYYIQNLKYSLLSIFARYSETCHEYGMIIACHISRREDVLRRKFAYDGY